MIRDEPSIRTNYVANGSVRLLFHPVLDHGRSLELHTIAECAGEQDPLAFWKVHDLLFERQNEAWAATNEVVLSWLDDLKLDQAKLQSCTSDGAVSEKLVGIDRERVNAGIRLRPTFQVNERTIEGAIPYEQFAKLFEGLLPK